jgi:uncharacterized Zn-binding protein involved in type VI secretion
MKQMKTKKIAAGILSAAVLTISAAGVFAASDVPLQTGTDRGQIVPISMMIDAQNQLFYRQFRGTVREISDHWSIEGAKYISLESSSGEPANVIADKSTYVFDNERIDVGSEITVYYDANAMMIMIYPPQYKAEVIVVENDSRNVKVDLFDEELVSADGMLKLMNISDVKDIVDEDGSAYKGELKGKVLAAVYTISTKSIPAQTTPEKIVVLDRLADAVQQPEEAADTSTVSVSGSDVYVNGSKIAAPGAFVSSAGVQMIPLRAAAEAMGFEVIWNSADRSVSIGSDIRLKVGEDSFTVNGAKVMMAEASLIIDGRTFVPADFFESVK